MTRRIVGVVSFVVLSFAMPTLIVGGAISIATSGKHLGRPSSKVNIYQGALKDGRLWFSTDRDLSTDPQTTNFEHKIKQIDLETGAERDTIASFHNLYFGTFQLDGTVYGLDAAAIYRFTEGKFERLIARPARSAGFYSIPFMADGRLTMISETAENGFRLVHLVDGQWVDGREIVLLGGDRSWLNDIQSRTVLSPRSQALFRKQMVVKVVQRHGHFHLLQTDRQRFGAYRFGFQFVDDSIATPSREPGKPVYFEPTGWEPVEVDGKGGDWLDLASDTQGILLSCHRRIVRRTDDGKWHLLQGCDRFNERSHPVVLADPQETTSYIVQENQRWGTVSIHRIEGNDVRAAHFSSPGFVPAYLRRWEILIFGILLAWLSHIGILVLGADWMTRSTPSLRYQFGNQTVVLATPFRRFLALSVDLFVLMAIFVGLVAAQFHAFGFATWSPSEPELAEWLFNNYERPLYEAIRNKTLWTNSGIPGFVMNLPTYVRKHEAFVMLGVAEAVVLFAFWTGLEARCRTTPGKYLARTTVVRTTMRPVGFANILARNIFLFVDLCQFITPLPGMISFVLSVHGQRIGDIVAGTLVINQRDDPKTV